MYKCPECGFESTKYFGLCPKCREGVGVELENSTPAISNKKQNFKIDFKRVDKNAEKDKATRFTKYKGLNAIISSEKGFIDGQVILLGASPGGFNYDLNQGYPSERNASTYSTNNQNKVSIVAVHKNSAGIITDYKLSDGRILDKQQAVAVAETEGINGVNVGRTRGAEHTKMLRANPTNDVEKALDNLPTF